MMSFYRARTGPAINTEYLASFRPPSFYAAITTQNLYHPLRGTSAQITSISTRYVSKQPTSSAPTPARPSVPPRRDIGTAQKLARPQVTRTDYTTTYQSDYKAWAPDEPFRPKANMSVDETVPKTGRPPIVGKTNFAWNRERIPFESLTTYRADYAPHPVQPRCNDPMPVSQSCKEPPEANAADQEYLECLQQFETWSMEAEDLDLSDIRTSLATAYKEPSCQGLHNGPSARRVNEKQREPLQVCGTALVKDQHTDSVKKAAECSYVDPPSDTKRQHHKMVNRAANRCCCGDMEKNQAPAGFPTLECSSSMFWSDKLIRGRSWWSLSHG
ncbi:uncharacterized protein LOC105927905 [Fundulus heteroclitus]|uniref:uncharacterized protein LOC105927905 n=1 Tax=Fundulus heteroclitus TaxID=8078 RepID=UPI00165AAB14|nr:uncharacterized protein LOC105927905 [Fundulus heteroclitus]